MARRSHPFPSRTRQLSSSATEVVGPQGPARYVRRPVNILRTKPLRNERLFLFITPTNKDDLSSAQTARNLSRLPTDKSRLAIACSLPLESAKVTRTRMVQNLSGHRGFALTNLWHTMSPVRGSKDERRLSTDRPPLVPPHKDSPWQAKLRAWALRSPLFSMLVLGVAAPIIVFSLYSVGAKFTRIDHEPLRGIVFVITLTGLSPLRKFTSRANGLMGALLVFVLLVAYLAMRPSVIHK